MDKEELFLGFDDPDATPGIIEKVANLSPLECSDEDLKKINKYTLSPLSADDVFIFKLLMADNEQDDRNSMPFNLKALQDLKKLYPGKTMLKDHRRLADNQIARIFDTELVQNENKQTDLGELHTDLIAKAYMVRTESNKDLISEIVGGIKKEVSTSTVPEKMICSICGTDNMKDYCRHYPGYEYEVTDQNGTSTKKKCKMLLSGAKEAYELSFVAVPAQPRAGTHKSVGFVKPIAEKATEEISEIETKQENNNELDYRLLSARLKHSESFFNAESEGM